MKFSLPVPFIPPVITGALLEQDETVSEIDWVTSDTVCIVTRGYLTIAIALRNMRKLEALMDHRVPRWLIVDFARMTGFDGIAQVPLERQLRRFRAMGGEEVLIVSTLDSVRILVPAMAAGAGIPIRVFDSPRDAFAHVYEQRRAAR